GIQQTGQAPPVEGWLGFRPAAALPDGIAIFQELSFLGVLERDEDHRITAGGHHAARESYDRVQIPPDGETVAGFETGGDIGYRLIMTARDLAPRHEEGWPSRHSAWFSG